MNIQDRIKELDILIEERTIIERALWNESTVKEDAYKKSTRVWADVHDVIRHAKEKRAALIELQKDCEVVISRGVPVLDEDIGMTVNIGIDLCTLIPVFKDGQEKEYLTPYKALQESAELNRNWKEP